MRGSLSPLSAKVRGGRFRIGDGDFSIQLV
jgi:hypothetical protein